MADRFLSVGVLLKKVVAYWIQSDTLQVLSRNTGHLAPVVQRADNFIQRIIRYPADKMYELEYILSAR